ncbi:MAG: RNA-dependent ATPase [Watsoniomyces obsoletus]|nr:MAG: RNA-dependent ATPase [Watsoniomyces obsoletus]
MATEGSAGSSNKITMEDQTQKEPQAASTHASGPSVSDHCTTDQPISSAQASSGELSELGDVDVYITKPNDYPHSPSKLLLFLTNGTGIHSLNNQLQADNYAKEGFLVVMPDMFAGDPAPKSNTVEPTPDEEQSSIIEQFKLHAAETAKSFLLDMWLARHTPEKVMPRVQKVLESMKEEFADAVANGGGVYAVGYCFGGKYVLELGQETQNTINTDEEQGTVNTGPAIKVGAIAHGTLVTLEDVIGVKVPISMVCVGE